MKADRFQRDLFREVMLHVRVEDLVKNHGAYQQRQGDGEADRRTPIPISLLRPHQLLFGKDEHFRAQPSLEAVPHLL